MEYLYIKNLKQFRKTVFLKKKKTSIVPYEGGVEISIIVFYNDVNEWTVQHWCDFRNYLEDISDIQNTNLTNKETKIPRPETMMPSIKATARTWMPTVAQVKVHGGGKVVDLA